MVRQAWLPGAIRPPRSSSPRAAPFATSRSATASNFARSKQRPGCVGAGGRCSTSGSRNWTSSVRRASNPARLQATGGPGQHREAGGPLPAAVLTAPRSDHGLPHRAQSALDYTSQEGLSRTSPSCSGRTSSATTRESTSSASRSMSQPHGRNASAPAHAARGSRTAAISRSPPSDTARCDQDS